MSTTKTTVSLAAILLAAFSAFAQPVLQSNVVPNIGDKVLISTADTLTIHVGNAGANQTWDMSGLQANAVPVSYEYLAPSGTPFFSNYPSANLVAKWADSSNVSTYGYERLESNQFSLLGAESAAYSLVYQNPDSQLKFPTSYNGTYTDNFSYTTDAGTGIPFLSTGSRSVKYDGYGTLKTPLGTFQNAIRIKAVTVQTDSANFFGNEILNFHNIVTYDWLVPNQPGALVSVSYLTTVSETRFIGIDTLVFESGPTLSGNFISGGSVGVFDAPGPLQGLSNLSVGPNPAVDELHLRFVAAQAVDLMVYLTDMQGKVLQQHSMRAQAGDNDWKYELSELPSGNYFLTVGNDSGLQSKLWQRL